MVQRVIVLLPLILEIVVLVESSLNNNPTGYSQDKENAIVGFYSASFEEIEKSLSTGNDAESYLAEIETMIEKKPIISIGSHTGALMVISGLKKAATSCSSKDFEVMAENYIVHQHRDKFPKLKRIFDHYSELHFQKCLPYYKKTLQNSMKDLMNNEDVLRVNNILRGIKKGTNLGDMVEFIEYELYLIVSRLQTVKSSPNFEAPSKGFVNKVLGRRAKSMSANSALLRDYLFLPCKNYVKYFKSILAPMNFYLNISDVNERKYLESDKDYMDTVMNERLCQALLEDSKNLSSNLEGKLEKLEHSKELEKAKKSTSYKADWQAQPTIYNSSI